MRLRQFWADDDTLYTFPLADAHDAYADNQARGVFVQTQTGGFDLLGPADSDDNIYRIVRQCTLIQDTPTLLEADIDDARAIRGKRGTLYATTYAGASRRIVCRCVGVSFDRTNRNFNVQPVTFTFETGEPYWLGDRYEPWTFDDTPQVYLDMGYIFDGDMWTVTLTSSPTTLAVTNAGNRTIYDPVLTLTAGSSNITAWTLENTTNAKTNISWSGTLTAGQSMVIDCGAFSVLNNGTDAYGSITINAAHATPYWMELNPGANNVKLTFTGGAADSTLTVNYSDGWA